MGRVWQPPYGVGWPPTCCSSSSSCTSPSTLQQHKQNKVTQKQTLWSCYSYVQLISQSKNCNTIEHFPALILLRKKTSKMIFARFFPPVSILNLQVLLKPGSWSWPTSLEEYTIWWKLVKLSEPKYGNWNPEFLIKLLVLKDTVSVIKWRLWFFVNMFDCVCVPIRGWGPVLLSLLAQPRQRNHGPQSYYNITIWLLERLLVQPQRPIFDVVNGPSCCADIDCLFNGSPNSALADFFQVMFKRIWPKNTVSTKYTYCE